MARPKLGVTAEDRLWANVTKTDTCWLWTGHTRKGYGRIMVGAEKNKQVHRFSWEIHYGPIPEGMDVLHKCNVRLCIRPDHLYLGTDVENVQDRMSVGGNHVGSHVTIGPCPQGHEFNEENFSIYWCPNAKHGPQWKRTCLVCARERMRRKAS